MDDLYRQFIGILLVLAALVALLWYARKRGFARLNLPGGGTDRLVKVLERVPLTPQHTLFVVSISGRTLVMASSPGSCQVITDLSSSPQALPDGVLSR
ncbi:MAG: flagellar biosynthetic protein FliO [Acidobacteriota bacterium]